MKLLFVASECAPFVKTGGLADVIGAVPKSLTAKGMGVKVLLPGYPSLAPLMKRAKVVAKFKQLFGGPARVLSARAEGLDLLMIDSPHLYDRVGSLYVDADGADWTDNHLRFGALSYVGAEVARGAIKGWQPRLVHAHDWQAGLVAAYLAQDQAYTPPVITTIHNIAFQGVFPASTLGQLGLDKSLFTPEGVEYWGKVSFLKAGLALSHRVTTVSPSYANELLTPEFGMGLEGLLQMRQKELSGILNGIDTEIWDPSNDPALPAPYSARGTKRKARSKTKVQKFFGLDSSASGPLFCVISRLTTQKGLDLLANCLQGLVARDATLAVLGTGDRALERVFRQAADEFPGRVGTHIGYNEDLSHLLQGGADAILIPSRFEPCGLTQLYGLRYGTLPIVARTGGLADTVIDANEAALATECATGVQFAPVTETMLDVAIGRACDLFKQPEVWQGMMRRAMRHPVGWDKSADAYLDLYTDLIDS
ncbi:MAG: glycogen synthase GlgA [Pseudomonadota bacterium]